LKRYLRPTVHKVVLVVPVKAVLGRVVLVKAVLVDRVDRVDLVDLEVPMFNNKKKS
jgi:hypothetical protein